MLVGKRMSSPVITVHPDLPVQEALNLMCKEKVSRFPVVDAHGKLVGIVTESDLMNASPSEATTLSVWEIGYLVSKITVERVMAKKVITISEDTPLEEAARIMADNHIGGLPVVRGSDLIGIITETDLFKIFLELLGARESGVRLSVVIRNEPGSLLKLTNAINSLGVNIVALGTFMGESPATGLVTVKVGNVDVEKLKAAVKPVVESITDVRVVKAT